MGLFLLISGIVHLKPAYYKLSKRVFHFLIRAFHPILKWLLKKLNNKLGIFKKASSQVFHVEHCGKSSLSQKGIAWNAVNF